MEVHDSLTPTGADQKAPGASDHLDEDAPLASSRLDTVPAASKEPVYVSQAPWAHSRRKMQLTSEQRQAIVDATGTDDRLGHGAGSVPCDHPVSNLIRAYAINQVMKTTTNRVRSQTKMTIDKPPILISVGSSLRDAFFQGQRNAHSSDPTEVYPKVVPTTPRPSLLPVTSRTPAQAKQWKRLVDSSIPFYDETALMTAARLSGELANEDERPQAAIFNDSLYYFGFKTACDIVAKTTLGIGSAFYHDTTATTGNKNNGEFHWVTTNGTSTVTVASTTYVHPALGSASGWHHTHDHVGEPVTVVYNTDLVKGGIVYLGFETLPGHMILASPDTPPDGAPCIKGVLVTPCSSDTVIIDCDNHQMMMSTADFSDLKARCYAPLRSATRASIIRKYSSKIQGPVDGLYALILALEHHALDRISQNLGDANVAQLRAESYLDGVEPSFAQRISARYRTEVNAISRAAARIIGTVAWVASHLRFLALLLTSLMCIMQVGVSAARLTKRWAIWDTSLLSVALICLVFTANIAVAADTGPPATVPPPAQEDNGFILSYAYSWACTAFGLAKHQVDDPILRGAVSSAAGLIPDMLKPGERAERAMAIIGDMKRPVDALYAKLTRTKREPDVDFYVNNGVLPDEDRDHQFGFGLPGFVSQSPLKTTHASANITLPPEYEPPMETFEDRTRTWLIGYGFPTVPFVPSKCIHNEYIAVHNRGCYNRSDLFNPMVGEIARQMHDPVPIVTTAKDFHAWNARFSGVRHQEQAEAFKAVHDGKDSFEYKDFYRKAFVKVEHHVKIFDDGYVTIDPRLIQGASTKANVILGPWTWQFANRMAKEWDGTKIVTVSIGDMSIKVHPFYATKKDPAGISDLFTEAVEFYSEPLFIATDGKRWDATITTKMQEAKQKVYNRYGMGDDLDRSTVYESQTRDQGVTGFTTNGIRYKVKGTVRSGDPDTSCGNSAINMWIHVWALLMCGVPEAHVWVLGDDNLIVTQNQTIDTDVFIHALESHGVIPTVTISTEIADIDFCSQRFWPVEGGYALGPKIGRWLVKAGWTTQNITTAPRGRNPKAYSLMVYKATMQAVAPYVSHVPFVRVFVEETLSLLDEVSVAKEVKDTVLSKLRHHWTGGVGLVPNHETWAMVEQIYGLTSLDEKRFRLKLQQCVFPCIVSIDWLAETVAHDL